MGAGGVREPGGWRPSAERLGVGGVREPGGGETRDRRARPAQGRARKYEVTENNGRKGGLEATPGLVEGGAGLHQRPAMGGCQRWPAISKPFASAGCLSKYLCLSNFYAAFDPRCGWGVPG